MNDTRFVSHWYVYHGLPDSYNCMGIHDDGKEAYTQASEIRELLPNEPTWVEREEMLEWS